jgi:hypothetical protein
LSNVVQFPQMNKIPTKAIQARKKIVKVQKDYADEIVDDLIDTFVNQIDQCGYYMKDAISHRKDLIAVRETMRALLYRYTPGLKHPMHEAIDYLIEIKDDLKPEEK